MVEWEVAELARRAGITTRTLRHYDQIGLLAPSRVTAAGVRHYDADAVARLQRILLLRDVGMPLAQIADLLEHEDEVEEVAALEEHITVLESQRAALEVRIKAVRHLLEARRTAGIPTRTSCSKDSTTATRPRWSEDGDVTPTRLAIAGGMARPFPSSRRGSTSRSSSWPTG